VTDTPTGSRAEILPRIASRCSARCAGNVIFRRFGQGGEFVKYFGIHCTKIGLFLIATKYISKNLFVNYTESHRKSLKIPAETNSFPGIKKGLP
jgi:hypothetical protein